MKTFFLSLILSTAYLAVKALIYAMEVIK